jgi:hypothetical protein
MNEFDSLSLFSERFHCHVVLGIYSETIGASFGFVLIHYRHYRYSVLSKDGVPFQVSQNVFSVQEFTISIKKLHPPSPYRFDGRITTRRRNINLVVMQCDCSVFSFVVLFLWLLKVSIETNDAHS